MPKTSVTLDDETFNRWKGLQPSVPLSDIIRLGLAVQQGQMPEPVNPDGILGRERQESAAKTEALDKLGRRVENLCAASEGLLKLLTEGYEIMRPPPRQLWPDGGYSAGGIAAGILGSPPGGNDPDAQ